MRSRFLKTTVLAAVAAAMWTQRPEVSLRLRRLSLKCWFMGHDDWIRRTPYRLYLECLECGRETPGWLTKNQPVDLAGGAFAGAPALKHIGDSALARVRSLMSPSPRSECSNTHHGGDITIAAAQCCWSSGFRRHGTRPGRGVRRFPHSTDVTYRRLPTVS